MLRNEIKEEDKWDLTRYFKTEEEFNKYYEETLNILDKIVSMKGHILKNAKSLLNYLEEDTNLSIHLETIYVYSYLVHYSDTNDEYGKILKEKADHLDEKIMTSLSFASSELLSADYDYIQKLIKQNKGLEKYAFALEKTFRFKEHTLSEQEEKIISLAHSAFGSCHSAFSSLDNTDVKFKSVEINGEEVELTHSNFIPLMNHPKQEVRKRVFETYYDYFVNHKNTIAELYKGQIKEDLFTSNVKKFNSPLEASLFNDNISVDVYKNLINTIHHNLEPIYEYMSFRKSYSNLKELHMYDIYYDIVEDVSPKFTFAEAKETIFAALKPLGENYLKDLDKAFNERWIDKYSNEGKRSGAYQWGSYGITPYVSVNFEGNEDSVSTLAHELGHAMHSYYSDKNQDYIYAQYPIFLAEIASTVNEVLLNEYLINNAKDDKEKLLYITSFLDKFRATVYRQTMFAEFEMLIHDEYQQGNSLTTESIANIYYDLNKLYYGNEVISDELIKYEWSRIPHFYTPFYVYKYATGFCAALAIASDILSGKENAREKYLEFLSSGGSNYPLDTLKKCGVDMTTSEPIEKGIKMFKDKLSLANQLREKVK